MRPTYSHENLWWVAVSQILPRCFLCKLPFYIYALSELAQACKLPILAYSILALYLMQLLSSPFLLLWDYFCAAQYFKITAGGDLRIFGPSFECRVTLQAASVACWLLMWAFQLSHKSIRSLQPNLLNILSGGRSAQITHCHTHTHTHAHISLEGTWERILKMTTLQVCHTWSLP